MSLHPRVVVVYLLLLSASAQLDAKSFQLGLNFTGSTRSDSGFFPPDTMGTVGPDHIVELINGRYAVYDKTTGGSLASSSLDQFWTSAGATPSGAFSFDPRIVYDPYSQRYFATAVDNKGGDNNILVGVSATNNPLNGWTAFKVDSDSDNTRWADFPMLGFNGDVVTIAAAMKGGSGDETSLLVIPKVDLISTSPTIVNATLIEDVRATTGLKPHPVVDLDNSDVPHSLWWTLQSDEFRRTNVVGTPTSPVLETTDISVNRLLVPPNAEQPGTKANLDNDGGIFSSHGVLQEGVFWGVQAVFDPLTFNSGLRWFKIDADLNDVIQEGVISAPELDLIYPSIAVNEFGDAVIGMTGSGENQFPSSYMVVGETDEFGNTSFGELTLLKAGVNGYEQLDINGRNRWGDYSATVVDPDDPFVFWTFQEFAVAEDEWAVQISEIRLVPSPSSVTLAFVAVLIFLWYIVFTKRFGSVTIC